MQQQLLPLPRPLHARQKMHPRRIQTPPLRNLLRPHVGSRAGLYWYCNNRSYWSLYLNLISFNRNLYLKQAMHSLVLSVPRDQHAQQLELLFSGRTRSAHLSHFHKDNTTKFELFVMVVVLCIIMSCFPPCKIQNQQIRSK